MTDIFLLAGRIASGKSTVAEYIISVLRRKNPDANILLEGFANAVKIVARDSFGWDGIKDEKGRRLLQVIGTEAGRAYNENIWAEKAYNFVSVIRPDIAVFDDWRFPNEYEVWLNKENIGSIYKIRCFRDKQEYSDHASETSLPESGDFYDYTFDNNIPISEIRKAVEDMLIKLL